MAHSGENKVWVCRSCGASAGALRSEAEGAAHVRTLHAAAAPRCACGALIGSGVAARAARPHRAYRCPVPACSDAFAVQYLLERHMQAHHAMQQQVRAFRYFISFCIIICPAYYVGVPILTDKSFVRFLTVTYQEQNEWTQQTAVRVVMTRGLHAPLEQTVVV